MSDEPLPVTLDNIRKWDADMRGSDDRARHIALYYFATNLREVVEMLLAELAEAREGRDRIMIATAASVKASIDEYKRGHADGEKAGREKGLVEAACIARSAQYSKSPATDTMRGIEKLIAEPYLSPKPTIL